LLVIERLGRELLACYETNGKKIFSV